MKSGLNRGIICLLSVVLFCVSCGDMDLFDTDKWTNEIEGLEPGIRGKIVQGEFSLWDLINQGEDDVIVKEGNKLFIQYTKPDIYTMNIDQVFKMEQEDLTFSLDHSIANPDFNPGTSLTTDLEIGGEGSPLDPISQEITKIPNGCVLSQLVASAQFVYPETGFAYEIEMEFPDIRKEDGEVLKLNAAVGAGENKTETLNNIVLTLDENQTVALKINRIVIKAGSVLTSADIHLDFGLNELQFIKAVGQIHADPVDITQGEFDMDVDFLNEIGGKFSFARPELNIIVRNWGIGVPLKVDANFNGSNAEGKKLNLKLNPGATIMTSGNKQSYMVADTLSMNRENSNIVEFLSLPPTGDISYQGKVYINPDDEDNNVVYSDGKIALDAYIRIPFELSAERMVYKDTLDDIDIDRKIADQIQSGKLMIVADNGLPLTVEIPSLLLVGETGETLKLEAEAGKLAAGGKGERITYALNKEQAAFLGKTKNILLEAVASTPNNEVKEITADAKLSFYLVVEAKTNITDFDDF